MYIINATYLGPLTLYIYYRFGRPSTPQKHTANNPHKKVDSTPSAMSPVPDLKESIASCHAHQNSETAAGSGTTQVEGSDSKGSDLAEEGPTTKGSCCKKGNTESPRELAIPEKSCCKPRNSEDHTAPTPPQAGPSDYCHKDVEKGSSSLDEQKSHDREGGYACHSGGGGGGGHGCHSDPPRPMWATILIGVSHCGAGCVLGDLVGEWLVYGTGAMINGHDVWAELLIDYAFALLFGIVFQYFSIAPMSGAWGPMTLWRAFKADVVSLTSFEVGAFGWMVAFQVGIFGYRIDMNTWLYWWMMQIGMALGACTAFPVNYWLIKHKVKEPCC